MKSPITRDKLKQDKVFNAMAVAIGKYLLSMGGSAVIVGGVSIEVGALKNRYTLKIGIVGKKPTKRNL